MTKKRNIILLLIAIAVVYIAMVIFAMYQPMTADDHNYGTNLNTGEHVSGFDDIWENTAKLYTEWTGRIIATPLISFFMWIGHQGFYFINAAIFVLLACLMCKYALPEKPLRAGAFVAVNLLMFLLIPKFNETTLWMAGSLNYMWGTALLFLFLLFYFPPTQEQFSRLKKRIGLAPFHIILAVLGFISGLMQENISFLGLGFLFLLLVSLWAKHKSFKAAVKRMPLPGIIAFIAGCAVLILAPGNFNRAGGGFAFNYRPFLSFANANKWAFLLLVVVFLLLLIFRREYFKRAWLLLAAPVVSFLPMLVIPEFSERSMFAGSAMLLAFICGGLYALLQRDTVQKTVAICAAAATLVLYAGLGYFLLSEVRPASQEREQLLTTAGTENTADVVLNRWPMPQGFYARYSMAEHDITPLYSSVQNYYLQRYYGYTSVRTANPGDALVSTNLAEEYSGELHLYALDTGEEAQSISGYVRMDTERVPPRGVQELSYDIPLKDGSVRFSIQLPKGGELLIRSIDVATLRGGFTSYWGDALLDCITGGPDSETALKDTDVLVYAHQDDTIEFHFS